MMLPRNNINIRRVCLLALTFVICLACAIDTFARVGGGQSYGGGSGGGGGDGDGGAIIWLVFQLIRFLLYLTIEYPAIGIPVDIVVVAGVVLYFVRRPKKTAAGFTAASGYESLGLATATSAVNQNV